MRKSNPHNVWDQLMKVPSNVMSPDEASRSATVNDARQVCPFCGTINASAEGPCPRCTLEPTPQTMQRTRDRIGPWYVLQQRNPSVPGMCFNVLVSLIEKKQVNANSIVRGPTTHQFWRFARQVRGLSRLFGVCHHCGGELERTADVCPGCASSQLPPSDPDTFLELQRTEPTDVVVPVSDSAPSQPAVSEPANDEAVQQPRSMPSDQILSPQQLAAVFKVNLSVPDDVAQMEPPVDQLEAPARSGRFPYVLTTLLVLVIGTTMMLVFNPPMRDQLMSLFTAATPPPAPSVNLPMPGVLETASSPRVERPAQPAPAPAVTAPEAPAAAPTEPQRPIVVELPVPPRPETPASASTGTGVRPVGDPAAIAAAEEAMQLWRESLSAGHRDDYRTSLQLLEKIGKLPRTAWPGGYEMRLQQVKQRLAEQKQDGR